jgi:hypothetical protein
MTSEDAIGRLLFGQPIEGALRPWPGPLKDWF